MSDDPFERALEKEQELRRRSRPDMKGMLRIAGMAHVAFLLGWTGLLLAHHKLWPSPDWLRVVHTVVFGLVVLYWLIAMVVGRVMMNRYLPNDLTESEPPT